MLLIREDVRLLVESEDVMARKLKKLEDFGPKDILTEIDRMRNINPQDVRREERRKLESRRKFFRKANRIGFTQEQARFLLDNFSPTGHKH